MSYTSSHGRGMSSQNSPIEQLILRMNTVRTPEEIRAARLAVCGAAKDEADAREMLDMLGLLP